VIHNAGEISGSEREILNHEQHTANEQPSFHWERALPCLQGVKMKHKKRWLYLLCAAALAISAVSLGYFRIPYVWIAGAWFVVTLYGALISQKPSVKALWFNISVVILTLGVFESYLWLSGTPERVRKEYSSTFALRHPILGYGPRTNVPYIVTTYWRDHLVYQVTYTIDARGFRISAPLHEEGNNTDCILFFGDSFTLGEGVKDHEAMPSRVGQLSEGKYRTYNFGYHGYGPHQMLAILENKLEDLPGCKPKFAVFQALRTHVLRVAGLSPWDQHGPRYLLGKDGHVRFAGHFDDSVIPALRKQLSKSLIGQMVLDKVNNNNLNNVDLFLGVVDAAKSTFENRYAGASFHVIFWDTQDCPAERCREILEGLSKRNIRVHLISNILPDYKENELKYTIGYGDRHPSALAHELIARYVVDRVLTQ